jgi:hypothetical protein
MRVEAGFGHGTDPDAIGFMFVTACEVNLLLGRRALSDCHAGLNGIATTARRGENKGAEHECRRQYALTAICMDGAGNVALRNVRDFVREYASQFVFAA